LWNLEDWHEMEISETEFLEVRDFGFDPLEVIGV
jgi:hypothetical protein